MLSNLTIPNPLTEKLDSDFVEINILDEAEEIAWREQLMLEREDYYQLADKY
jgi:hypothetical protein